MDLGEKKVPSYVRVVALVFATHNKREMASSIITSLFPPPLSFNVVNFNLNDTHHLGRPEL